jgi:hypothetical protein
MLTLTTNQDMLIETPKTCFDDSYASGTPEHAFAYRKLLALHDAGDLLVLRIWNSPDRNRYAEVQSPDGTGSRATNQKRTTALMTPSKPSSHSRRHLPTCSVDMKDVTSSPSVCSSVSSDSVYKAHSTPDPASPSQQLLDS